MRRVSPFLAFCPTIYHSIPAARVFLVLAVTFPLAYVYFKVKVSLRLYLE